MGYLQIRVKEEFCIERSVRGVIWTAMSEWWNIYSNEWVMVYIRRCVSDRIYTAMAERWDIHGDVREMRFIQRWVGDDICRTVCEKRVRVSDVWERFYTYSNGWDIVYIVSDWWEKSHIERWGDGIRCIEQCLRDWIYSAMGKKMGYVELCVNVGLY